MNSGWGDRKLARHYIRVGDLERAAYFAPELAARAMADRSVRQALDGKHSTLTSSETPMSNNLRRACEIDEMVRFAAEKATRRVMTSPRSSPTMTRQPRGVSAASMNALFQRSPGDPGYLDPPMPALAMDSRRRARDAEPDEALENMRKALIHAEAVRDGESELDIDRLHGYLTKALETLEAGHADDGELDVERFGEPLGDEDDDEIPRAGGGPNATRDERQRWGAIEPENDPPPSDMQEWTDMTPEQRSARLSGADRRARRGRDGISAPPMALKRSAPARDADVPAGRREVSAGRGRVGQTRARSTVTLEGRRGAPDHREDFASHAGDGAPFDADALFQKGAGR